MKNLLIIIFLVVLIVIYNAYNRMDANTIIKNGGNSAVVDQSPDILPDFSKLKIDSSNLVKDYVAKREIKKIGKKKKKHISFNPVVKVRYFDKETRQILHDN
jgi:hypothetical protein